MEDEIKNLESILKFMGCTHQMNIRNHHGIYWADPQSTSGEIPLFCPDGIAPMAVNIEYQTNWNWIMMVIEKIETLEDSFVDISKNYTRIMSFNHYEEWYDNDSKRNTTYKAIVEFIKWYNEELKNRL